MRRLQPPVRVSPARELARGGVRLECARPRKTPAACEGAAPNRGTCSKLSMSWLNLTSTVLRSEVKRESTRPDGVASYLRHEAEEAKGRLKPLAPYASWGPR